MATLKERILLVCKDYLEQDKRGLNLGIDKDEDAAFYKGFEKYIKSENGASNLFKRGSEDDLSTQWQQNESEMKERQFHKILSSDQIQKISVSGLIEEMKELDSQSAYNFMASSRDINQVEELVKNGVLEECRRTLQKALQKPRFQCNELTQLKCLDPKSERQKCKGMLTRALEKDTTLLSFRYDKEIEGTEMSYYRELCQTFYAGGQLLTGQHLYQNLEWQCNNKRIKKLKFEGLMLCPSSLKVQKISQEICESIESSSRQTERDELQVKGFLGLSFISMQLKHILMACKKLLDLDRESESKGKLVEIDSILRQLHSILPQLPKNANKCKKGHQLKIFYGNAYKHVKKVTRCDRTGCRKIYSEKDYQEGSSRCFICKYDVCRACIPCPELLIFDEPEFGEQIIEKTMDQREFDQGLDILSIVTGQQFENEEQQVSDSYATALENLFALVFFLKRYAATTSSQLPKDQENNSKDGLFLRPFVIDQSEQTYQLLLQLLTSTQDIAKNRAGQEQEIGFYLFDGFRDIMLNNLLALFESERKGLNIIFRDRGGVKWGVYLQEKFYPELLQMILWRIKTQDGSSTQQQAIEMLFKWQKVLPFEGVEKIKSIYEGSELEKYDEYYKLHLLYMPGLHNFDENEYDNIVKSLELEDVVRTQDYDKIKADQFDVSLSRAQEYAQMAIKRKNPAVSKLIQQVFKKQIGQENDAVRTVGDALACQLKSLLFLSSGSQQSKLQSVIQDLLSQGVEFKQNSFTTNLLRMLTADSVNILRNVKAVELKTDISKPKIPWKSVVQAHNLHGSNGGSAKHFDLSEVKDATQEFKLPVITEIGIYVSASNFVKGVSIFYKGGPSFEHKGNGQEDSEYKYLKLARGEHITQVHGRFGCWGDQLKITTSLGRVCQGGGNGGHALEPLYPAKAYIVGLDCHFGNYLERAEVHYVNLDEVNYDQENPLLTLISESDLLSKGIEQKHMGILSKDVLDEIRLVQDVIGKPILMEDKDNQSTLSDIDMSKSAATGLTEMISTTGFSNQLRVPAPESDDLHAQIIHQGQNALLDDLFQVLQLLLKESREPIRAQLNIMKEKGMAVARACFAVIVKLSGLTNKLDGLLQNLGLQEPDFDVEDPQERIQLMKELVKEDKSHITLLTEWTNATKMRKWLRENTDLEAEDGQAKLSKILESVISKANFLTKLEESHIFKSMNPNQELFELSHKIPSYARDDNKDEEELKETPCDEPNLWREHYKTWKTNLKNQGAILSQQQQHTEIRQVGTATILVCLQHHEITKDILQKIVETNYLNSCYRLAGLQLLELVILLIQKQYKDEEEPNSDTMQAVRNVAAALSKGIRQDSDESCHYLNGIKSCGNHLQSMIRKSFFTIIKGVSDYLAHADQAYVLEILSCLDWNFKARDFEELQGLKVFKLLHTGVPRQLKQAEGQPKIKQNIVLQSWQSKPFDPLTKELQVITSNLYMGIVSRLAEPEARKIIFEKKEAEATGVTSLTRVASVVNVSACQALLAEEFDIMFREFHEFILVGSRIGRYLPLEQIKSYNFLNDPKKWFIENGTNLISQTMEKIIRNDPYDQNEQEERKGYNQQHGAKLKKAESQKNTKKEFPVEKPWKKSKSVQKKPSKVYDSTKYTQEQMEVLELLFNTNQQLNEHQRAIHQTIKDMDESNDLFGLFDDEDQDEGPKVEIFINTKIDSEDVPRVRQSMVQQYRNFKQETNIARYLNLVQIFVKIATKAPYPLEMLQNVANPYHLKTLIQMLFQVSVQYKLQIITILQTLIRIQVPLSIFDEGVKDFKKFQTPTKVSFKSSFAQTLFSAALQIQSKTWDSSFIEDSRSGMYDVSVQLTRTVALCLKIQSQATKNDQETPCGNEEVSLACLQISRSELSGPEVNTVMQLMQATCTMPIYGDNVLIMNKSSEGEKQPETAQEILWENRDQVFSDSKFAAGYLVLPNFTPDSQIPLTLNLAAKSGIVQRLADLSSSLTNDSVIETILETTYLTKLLILQQRENKDSGLIDLTQNDRKVLVNALSKISSLEVEKGAAKKDVFYNTSIVEMALAIHMRDQIEVIKPITYTESQEQNTGATPEEESKDVAPKKVSKPKIQVNKNSAGHKYSKQLLSQAKKRQTDTKQTHTQASNKLMNSLMKGVIASTEEVIQMSAAAAEFCRFSGCSLLEFLYAINKTIPDDKRFFTSESLIAMFNEWLVKLAENDDPEKEQEIEKQFVELVCKKIEKIASLQKADTFKTTLIANINLEEAIEEVETSTHGMSSLMRSRMQDKLFTDDSLYQKFSEQMLEFQENNAKFSNDFNAEVIQGSKSSNWPLESWPVIIKSLCVDENDKKSAKILAKRFAEKLLFSVFDPSQDFIEQQDDSRDIADVMAGLLAPVNTLSNFYISAFGSVQLGLSGHAKSMQIFKRCNNIECSWEVQFSENFKIESNLSQDFNSLRSLGDYAFTKNMVNATNSSSMTNRAEQMLNHQLLKACKSTPELEAKGQTFKKYLIKNIINAILDDYGFQQNEKLGVRYEISLLNALTQVRPYQASSFELVERVKLIICAVLKSKSTQLIGSFAADLLNLSLYTFLLPSTTLPEKRLLIDQAYQIVEAFDTEDLEVYVEMGAWEKVAQSQVLTRTLDSISYENFKTDEINVDGKLNQPLYVILLFDLQSNIEKINKKASVLLKKELNKMELKQQAQDVTQWLKEELTQKLSNTDLHTILLNDFLASPALEDKFTSTKIIPVTSSCDINAGEQLQFVTLDLGFQDGAVVELKVEPKNQDEKFAEAQIQFEVKYSELSGKEDFKSLKFFSDVEQLETLTLKQSKVEFFCIAQKLAYNIKAVGHDTKLRRSYAKVKQVLPGPDQISIFAITDQSVYQEKAEGSTKIDLPENFQLSDSKITQISDFGTSFMFLTSTGETYSNKSNDNIMKEIDGQKVIKRIFKEQICVYILADGSLRYQGLFDKLSSAVNTDTVELNLQPFDASSMIQHFAEGDIITDLQIGGTGFEKYAIMTVVRNGNKVLYSKNFSYQILLGKGCLEGDEEKFYMLGNQTQRSSFQKVFLFDTVAFAIDGKGKLWVLGGKMAIQDDTIFPRDLGCEYFVQPTKTEFTKIIRQKIELGDDQQDQMEITDLQYSSKVILVTLNLKRTTESPTEIIQISLTDGGEGKYIVSRVEQEETFIFNEQLYRVSHDLDDEESKQMPESELKLTIKPRLRNMDNISMEMLSSVIDPASETFEDLFSIGSIAKNQELFVKAYRAINNWVRVRLQNELPSTEQLKQAIHEVSSEFKSEQYNPLKCWNDIDKEKDVRRIITAIINANIDMNMSDGSLLASVRQQILSDPLLNDSLLKERADQNSGAPSLKLSALFCKANTLFLTRIQSEAYQNAEKPPQCEESRIEVDFHRFLASQYGLDGKVDRGDGDTLYSQLFRRMESAQKDNYKQWWRREGPDNRVYRANFRGEGSIDAGGPYREIMENCSRELCSGVLPVLIPTENQRAEHGIMRECFVLNHLANTAPELKQIHHFGLIIGFAIRSMQTWNIALHPIIWKEITGVPLDPDEDLKTSDKFMHQMFQHMREQANFCENDEQFGVCIENQCFTIDFGLGETELMSGGSNVPVTKQNLESYIKMASMRILQKASVQMEHFLSGVYFVSPKFSLQMLNWRSAEVRAMGEPFIDMGVLKQFTNNETVSKIIFVSMIFT